MTHPQLYTSMPLTFFPSNAKLLSLAYHVNNLVQLNYMFGIGSFVCNSETDSFDNFLATKTSTISAMMADSSLSSCEANNDT